MEQVHYRVCNLCEAMCGVEIAHDGEKVLSIRGDAQDPFSRGHICPKAVALQDLHHDPDRLRRPLRRRGNDWEEVAWEDAFDEIGARLREIRKIHGRDAVAMYLGNPTAHSHTALLYGLPMILSLGTKNRFSATSVDQLPRMLVSLELYGHQALFPIPDIDRTDFLLILGANPQVSNGSIMTAPDIGKRLAEIQARGGRVIVVDPRRTETAAAASRHHFIRPGTDALLLLAMLETIFGEGLSGPGKLESFTDGVATIRQIVGEYPASRVSEAVGIDADSIRALARDFAGARSAVCYGRVGTCTQEFGTLSTWLIDVLNIVTGNLDRAGGAMFTTPAVDVVKLAAQVKQTGTFARYHSRVSGLPEFGGELPVAALAEEIETPGERQIRALITHAGNPVLSTPNGRRLDQALGQLDFMVSIDIYLNETTRHADFILPPTSALERPHFDFVFHVVSIRNTVRYSEALFEPAPDAKHDWEIFLELATRLADKDDLRGRLGERLARWVGRRIGPERALDWAIRVGPHGDRFAPWSKGLNLAKVKEAPHGIDLGPLEPRLPATLYHRSRRIRLAPERFVADLRRLDTWLADLGESGAGDTLLLIGRRELRSNNSWMHNSHRLVKGRHRCTLRIHPTDAKALALGDGEAAEVRSRVGSIEVPVEITDEMMPGTVSLPHGWGHDREGVRLGVASARPGVSINDITDHAFVDELSGTTAFSGVPVRVTPSPQR